MPSEDRAIMYPTSVKREEGSVEVGMICDPTRVKREITDSAMDCYDNPQNFLEVDVAAFGDQNMATPASTTPAPQIKQETGDTNEPTDKQTDNVPVPVKQELVVEFEPPSEGNDATQAANDFYRPECPSFHFESLRDPLSATASTSTGALSYFYGDNSYTGHAEEKPYKCPICDYQSKAKGNVKKHMLTHSGEKPYKCEQCDYQTSNSSNLKMHMSVHSEKKTFHCTACNYQCTHIKSLRRHMLTHAGQEPYKCKVCEYKTIFQGNLKKHMLRHTGEKPYKCEKCDYQSSNGSNLKMHMNTHQEKRTYQCGVCKYQCKHIKSLHRHFKKHAEKLPAESKATQSIDNTVS